MDCAACLVINENVLRRKGKSMSLKLRLTRHGAKKRPLYYIVVADVRAPRDGRFIEKLGRYNPMLPSDHADRVIINEERVKYWLSVGAQPTDRVERFLGFKGIMPKKAISVNPIKSQPKKKTQERLAAEADRQAKAAAAEKEAQEAAKAAAEAPAPAPEPETSPEPKPAPEAESALEPASEPAPAEEPAEAPAEAQAEENPEEEKPA
jgi:small subunit ribosomal protein S16